MKLGPEDRIQIAILDFIETVLPHAVCFHVANGGKRHIREAQKFKLLGVLPGVPDLILIPGSGKVYVLEVKAPKGRVSPEQREVMDRLHHLGIEGAVVRSVEDVRLALRAWGVRTREAAQ